jgi:hypothetical protein
MDTAWKLGYAAGIETETIGWLSTDSTGPVAQAQIFDHWMHGWKHKGWVAGLLDLVAIVTGLTRVSAS